jgi:hypothetical protein
VPGEDSAPRPRRGGGAPPGGSEESVPRPRRGGVPSEDTTPRPRRGDQPPDDAAAGSGGAGEVPVGDEPAPEGTVTPSPTAEPAVPQD